jgi:glycosyltransferase involved in cell wall biosynthesis
MPTCTRRNVVCTPYLEKNNALKDIPEANWPKVTIVTPSYNQGHFIEKTIQSVLSQTYPKIEYLIIDGGSSDATCDVVRKYSDRIDYWVSEPDNGQSDAINKGWARSTGDILAWLNSDDYFLPGAVESAANALVSHSEASFVYGDAILVDWHGNSIGDMNTHSRAMTHKEFMRRRIPYQVPQPTTFYRRSSLMSAGMLNVDLHYAMDFDLFMRLLQAGPAVYLPRRQAAMRLYPGTKTSTNVTDNWHEKLGVLRQYDRYWFLSIAVYRYMLYRIFRLVPRSVRNSVRSVRKRPRDLAYGDDKSIE